MFWAFEGAAAITTAAATHADMIGRTGLSWFLENGIFEPRSILENAIQNFTANATLQR